MKYKHMLFCILIIARATYAMETQKDLRLTKQEKVRLKQIIIQPDGTPTQYAFAHNATPFAWHETSGIIAAFNTDETLGLYTPNNNQYVTLGTWHIPYDAKERKTYTFNAAGTHFAISYDLSVSEAHTIDHTTHGIDTITKKVTLYTHTEHPYITFDAANNHMRVVDGALYKNNTVIDSTGRRPFLNWGPTRHMSLGGSLCAVLYSQFDCNSNEQKRRHARLRLYDFLTNKAKDIMLSVEPASIQTDGSYFYTLCKNSTQKIIVAKERRTHRDNTQRYNVLKIKIPHIEPVLICALSKQCDQKSTFNLLPLEVRNTIALYVHLYTQELRCRERSVPALNGHFKVHPSCYTQVSCGHTCNASVEMVAEDAEGKTQKIDSIPSKKTTTSVCNNTTMGKIIDKNGHILCYTHLCSEDTKLLLGWRGTHMLAYNKTQKNVTIRALIDAASHANMQWYAHATPHAKQIALRVINNQSLSTDAQKLYTTLPESVRQTIDRYKQTQKK